MTTASMTPSAFCQDIGAGIGDFEEFHRLGDMGIVLQRRQFLRRLRQQLFRRGLGEGRIERGQKQDRNESKPHSRQVFTPLARNCSITRCIAAWAAWRPHSMPSGAVSWKILGVSLTIFCPAGL